MTNKLFTCLNIAILLLLSAEVPAMMQNSSHLITKPCGNSLECRNLGAQALTKGELEKARHYFWYEIRYAEDIRDNKAMLLAYNNVALLHEREGEYPFALAWINQALRIDEHDPATLRAANQVQKKIKAKELGKGVSGTYVKYAGKAYWNAFCIRERDGGEAPFLLHMIFFTTNWRTGPATEDLLQGSTQINNGNALFSGNLDLPKCSIKMKFLPNKVVLEQTGECSIDYRLSATGEYDRVSNQPCDKNSLPLPLDPYTDPN